MKFCNKCSTEKPKSDFCKQSARKDGLCTVCKLCRSKQKKEYYINNLEKCTEANRSRREERRESDAAVRKAYYIANKEKCNADKRAWRERNYNYCIEKSKQYRAKNKERILARNRCRKSALKLAAGKHSESDVLFIFEKQKGLCANCKIKLLKSGKSKFHVDHIMPLARGGSNWPSNLQCLCPSCNMRKHAKSPEDWAKENGRLI